MNDQQKELFVGLARLGVSCGLWHPYEWLINYLRALDTWCAYGEIPKRTAEANEAFLVFFKECAAGEGDPLSFWKLDDMNAAIEKYFEERNKCHNDINSTP